MNITVRELRSNLSKYLKEGCTVIDGNTKEVIAKIVVPSEPDVQEKLQLQQKYITELESQIKPSTLEIAIHKTAQVLLPNKYIPVPCQFYLHCDEPSVGQFTLGQVVDGSWVEVPFKHLCQKHADFVAKNKAASWDL